MEIEQELMYKNKKKELKAEINHAIRHSSSGINSGITKTVMDLRRLRHELNVLIKEYYGKKLYELLLKKLELKRSLLEEPKLELRLATELVKKELESNPAANRVNVIEKHIQQRKIDFSKVVKQKRKECIEAATKIAQNIFSELKANPSHDVNTLSMRLNMKYRFSEDYARNYINLFTLVELKKTTSSQDQMLVFLHKLKKDFIKVDEVSKLLRGKITIEDEVSKFVRIEMKKEDDLDIAKIHQEEQENGKAIEAWRQVDCTRQKAIEIVKQIEEKIRLTTQSDMTKFSLKFHHASIEIKRYFVMIAKYEKAFLENSEFLEMPIKNVIKRLKNPTETEVQKNPLCTYSCSVEDLLSAMKWLSTGLGGMVKGINPIGLFAILSSTFTSSICNTGASMRLFELIKSKVLNGGKIGPDADSEARVHHARNKECLSCYCCTNCCTVLKYGPTGSSKRYHESTDFSKTGLHCRLTDGAMQSMIIGLASLNEYSLFTVLLYICQLMDYLYSPHNVKMFGVKIDDKKVRDVKYLLSILFRKHLPTHPILSLLVNKYEIPVNVSNPIDPTVIADALHTCLSITEEEGHARLSEIWTAYQSKADERLKETKERLTRSCESDASFMNWYHDPRKPCPPGCWCSG